MSRLVDRVGERFGRLTVVSRAPNICERLTAWQCRCDCGKTSIVTAVKLVTGRTKSCGCLRVELGAQKNLSHGATAGCRFNRRGIPPEYRAWASAKGRCQNPRNHAFADYGGRGIRMCDRWLADYAAFLSDMGPRPSAVHSLDRIDVNGDYTPDNCRWATRIQQASNTRKNVRVSIDGGPSVTLRAAARQFDVAYVAMYKAVVMRGEAPEVAIARLRARGSRFGAQR